MRRWPVFHPPSPAQEKAATIEREIAAKEASAKASQAAAAAAEAASKASASSRADEGLAARVEAAHALNQELYTQILDHIKQVTGATGSYIAVKESAAGGGDEEEPKASLTFIAASANHGQLIGKKVTCTL